MTSGQMAPRCRFRDLGFTIGELSPGPLNAITDVDGVQVGLSTLQTDAPVVARTGVTTIWPRSSDIWRDGVFGGFHSFNGYGEMTGLAWLAEQGVITEPIALTNSYSVGVVRDAICELAEIEMRPYAASLPLFVNFPVVSETYDGILNDIRAQAVTKEIAFEALRAASSGPVPEGNVGGGAGMICHEFKGGTGTSSRVTPEGFTVGVLVQANYGRREHLRIDGVPVGAHIGVDDVPSYHRELAGKGSVVVVIATDAPLIPIQCQRLARRATTGLAWSGGIGGNSSGDIFLAFSTANRLRRGEAAFDIRMISPGSMTPLFLAAAEATHEAIVNALCAAETMTGHEGATIHALPLDRLSEVMRVYRAAGEALRRGEGAP